MTNKTSRRNPRKIKERRTATRPAVLAGIEWSTRVAPAPRRWWWFLLVGLGGLAWVLIEVHLQSWTGVALAVVATVGLLILNKGSPRTHKITVTPERITLDVAGLRKSHVEIDMAVFNAFTFTEAKPSRRERSMQPTLTFLPVIPVQIPLTVFMTRNEKKNQQIIDDLATLLPYDPAPVFQKSTGVLDRLARWFGID
ncbi:hypothetical protein ACFOYW_18370 [Gryllotalpicola reticulitermitis]|uniref:PH domain-containing protein n=1 Tax=Gryllotalpicola reticulitermitis TaxID=1184153 RepID=A0ABV8QDB5_9MICO